MREIIPIFGEVLADVFPDRSVLGGAPYNVARHLQAFGLEPVMISSIGNDALGDAVLAEMDGSGMDTSGIQFDLAHPTGQVEVKLEGNSHRFNILPDQAYDHISHAIAQEALANNQPALMYFGTLAQRSLQSRLALETIVDGMPCPLFLDLNLRAPWFTKETIMRSLAMADILKLNQEELATVADLLGLIGNTELAHAQELQQHYGLNQVIVTQGEAGSWLLNSHGQQFSVKNTALPQAFVDSVGAGDAYSAVYILGMIERWDVEVSLQRASEFASAICTIRGAAADAVGFYEPYIDRWFA